MKGTVSGKQCQCRACNRTFSTENNFDKHRKGDYDSRVCIPPEELDMVLKDGVWKGKPDSRLRTVLNLKTSLKR